MTEPLFRQEIRAWLSVWSPLFPPGAVMLVVVLAGDYPAVTWGGVLFGLVIGFISVLGAEQID